LRGRTPNRRSHGHTYSPDRTDQSRSPTLARMRCRSDSCCRIGDVGFRQPARIPDRRLFRAPCESRAAGHGHAPPRRRLRRSIRASIGTARATALPTIRHSHDTGTRGGHGTTAEIRTGSLMLRAMPRERPGVRSAVYRSEPTSGESRITIAPGCSEFPGIRAGRLDPLRIHPHSRDRSLWVVIDRGYFLRGRLHGLPAIGSRAERLCHRNPLCHRARIPASRPGSRYLDRAAFVGAGSSRRHMRSRGASLRCGHVTGFRTERRFRGSDGVALR
jgi:hypothetical protein